MRPPSERPQIDSINGAPAEACARPQPQSGRRRCGRESGRHCCRADAPLHRRRPGPSARLSMAISSSRRRPVNCSPGRPPIRHAGGANKQAASCGRQARPLGVTRPNSSAPAAATTAHECCGQLGRPGRPSIKREGGGRRRRRCVFKVTWARQSQSLDRVPAIKCQPGAIFPPQPPALIGPQ